MGILTDPLDDAQRALLNVIWPLFAEYGEFPVYTHVEYRMAEQGLDVDEVLASLPSIGKMLYRSRYRAIDYTAGGGLPQPDSRVYLTMAGLYHVKDHRAMDIIGGLLAFMSAMSDARQQIANNPFTVPNVNVSLSSVRKALGADTADLRWLAEVAEHEWPGMSVIRQSGAHDVSGRLGLVAKADFLTIEQYLTAITAATTPQQQTTILDYRDPNALAQAITNFDITCELVLKSQLIKKPALTRTALFGQDAASHSDLQAGVSALGELLSELQVPGKKPSHPTGRLLGYLAGEMPNIDQARVQDAINLMDAVREIRNSGVHPKPSDKLIAAHDLLGLAFPVRDPAEAWNIIRAQMDVAFSQLQEEIYAARP